MTKIFPLKSDLSDLMVPGNVFFISFKLHLQVRNSLSQLLNFNFFRLYRSGRFNLPNLKKQYEFIQQLKNRIWI